MRRVSYRLGCVVVVFTSLVACAQVTPALRRAQAVSGVAAAGQRRLAELDVTADGRVDSGDWEFFERIEQAAQAAWGQRQTPPAGDEVFYYSGPPDDGSHVFSWLRLKGDAVDLSRVPPPRLPELAIEARWLAQQARWAALAGGPVDQRTVGGLLAERVPGYNPDILAPNVLCQTVGSIDLRPLQKAGLTATAVIDLDSTVWAGDVIVTYLAVLVGRKLLQPEANVGLRQFLKTLAQVDAAVIDASDVHTNARLLLSRMTDAQLPLAARVGPKDGFFQIAGLLQGLTESTARYAARVAFEEGALGFAPCRERILAAADGCSMDKVIASMSSSGMQVYLLSATLDVLAYEAARLFGIPPTRARASVLQVKDGRYTGMVLDDPYDHKGYAVRQLLPTPPLLAFGDSAASDFPMLIEAVGAGFMINASPALLARDRNEADSRLVRLLFGTTLGALRSKKKGKSP